MSTQHPNAGNAPFALPLRPQNDVLLGHQNTILDRGENTVILINGLLKDPVTIAQRDYVIAAVNSFPLLEEMREALEACVADGCNCWNSGEDGHRPGCSIQKAIEVLAQGKPSR